MAFLHTVTVFMCWAISIIFTGRIVFVDYRRSWEMCSGCGKTMYLVRFFLSFLVVFGCSFNVIAGNFLPSGSGKLSGTVVPLDISPPSKIIAESGSSETEDAPGLFAAPGLSESSPAPLKRKPRTSHSLGRPSFIEPLRPISVSLHGAADGRVSAFSSSSGARRKKPSLTVMIPQIEYAFPVAHGVLSLNVPQQAEKHSSPPVCSSFVSMLSGASSYSDVCSVSPDFDYSDGSLDALGSLEPKQYNKYWVHARAEVLDFRNLLIEFRRVFTAFFDRIDERKRAALQEMYSKDFRLKYEACLLVASALRMGKILRPVGAFEPHLRYPNDQAPVGYLLPDACPDCDAQLSSSPSCPKCGVTYICLRVSYDEASKALIGLVKMCMDCNIQLAACLEAIEAE